MYFLYDSKWENYKELDTRLLGSESGEKVLKVSGYTLVVTPNREGRESLEALGDVFTL